MIFFKKKPANRRVVKRARLYRMSRSVIDWLTLIGKMALVVLVLFGLYEFFVASSYFRLSEVEINGELEHVSRAKVEELAQIPYKKNIFSVNLFGIVKNIRRHPWIQHVQIRRKFPSGLIIHVQEHQPFAILQAQTNEKNNFEFFLMNQEGILFQRIKKHDMELPLIRGFELDKLKNYPGYFRPKIKEAFIFLKQFQELSKLDELEVESVHYDVTNGIMAILKSKNENKAPSMEVFFGKGDFDKKISVWNRFGRQMKEESALYSKIDLHVLGKVFARR